MGDRWQWFGSKIKGPIFPMFVKNSGAQSIPIPDVKGLKKMLKGKENKIEPINKALSNKDQLIIFNFQFSISLILLPGLKIM